MAEPTPPANAITGRDRHLKYITTSADDSAKFFIFIDLKSYFHLSVNPFDTIMMMLGPAIETHWTHVLRTCLLPRVAIAQPIISLLNLDNDIHSYWERKILIR